MGLYRSRKDGRVVAAMKLKKHVQLDHLDGSLPLTGASGSWIVLSEGEVWFERDVAFVDVYTRIQG